MIAINPWRGLITTIIISSSATTTTTTTTITIFKRLFCGKDQHSIPALIENDKVYADPLSKAKLLNDYFVHNAPESVPDDFALPPMRYSMHLAI